MACDSAVEATTYSRDFQFNLNKFSIGIANKIREGQEKNRGQFLVRERDFSLLHTDNTAFGFKQSPIELVPGVLSPSVKQSEREANYSPLSSADVKNGGPTPLPYAFSWTVYYLIKYKDNIILTLICYVRIAMEPM